MTRNANGHPLRRNISQEEDGTWGVNVWMGGINGLGTNECRKFYATRSKARDGDISDNAPTGPYRA